MRYIDTATQKQPQCIGLGPESLGFAAVAAAATGATGVYVRVRPQCAPFLIVWVIAIVNTGGKFKQYC